MIEYLYTWKIFKEVRVPRQDVPIKVRLDGKIAGTIKPVEGGFQYFPKGSKNGGVVFETLISVQRSLEQNG